MQTTPNTFTTVYDGRTWTVDIAEASPGHVIARTRNSGTVYYQAIAYSKDRYTASETWGFAPGTHTTLEAARASLDGPASNAYPDRRLERIARAAIEAPRTATA